MQFDPIFICMASERVWKQTIDFIEVRSIPALPETELILIAPVYINWLISKSDSLHRLGLIYPNIGAISQSRPLSSRVWLLGFGSVSFAMAIAAIYSNDTYTCFPRINCSPGIQLYLSMVSFGFGRGWNFASPIPLPWQQRIVTMSSLSVPAVVFRISNAPELNLQFIVVSLTS